MEVGGGVYKFVGDGNVYLVMGARPMLIDCGDVREGGRLKSEIEKVVSLDKVEVVLLTHLHYDHAGNVGLFPNAEIYASVAEIEDYRAHSEYFFFDGIPKGVGGVLKKLRPLPSSINGVEVIECPGHTRGSVAFLDRKRKLLFSGDVLFERGVGRFDLPNSVPSKVEFSVRKLRGFLDEGFELMAGHDY